MGEDRVEFREAFRQLEGLGSESVLVEGAPRPNAQLVDDGLLDELCLTVAPRMVALSGRGGRGTASGAP